MHVPMKASLYTKIDLMARLSVSDLVRQHHVARPISNLW